MSPHRLARLRVAIDEVVLHRGTSPDEEARIAEIARTHTVRIIQPLLVMAAVLGLVWWPFDVLLYRDEPDVVRMFAAWRAAILVFCAVYYVTCDRVGVARRYPAAWGTALGVGITFAVACALGSLGPTEEPWFASLLLPPVMSFPFLLRPSARLLGTAAVGVAGLAGWYASGPSALADLGTEIGLMAFSVAVSTIAGHATYHLWRVGLLRAEELDRRTRELEEQHDARRAELRLLASHLTDLREVERSSLARDLHDDLGPLLATTRLELERAERVRQSGGDVGAQHRRLVDLLDATLASTRSTLSRLRPRIVEDLGLVAALEWLARDTRRRASFDVRFRAEPDEVDLPDDVAVGVFRIVQEALTNVQRHADARSVDVTLTLNAEGLAVYVDDDGVGLPEAPRPGALGVIGMRERAAALGGQLDVTSSPGQGTRVAARFPNLRDDAPRPTPGAAPHPEPP